MNQVSLDAKRAGETLIVPFDFTSRLAVGETISSASTVASVWTGTDAAPSSIISTLAIVGKQARQKITGGVAGVIYTLVCTAITSAGNTLQLSGLLPVL